MGKFQWEVVAKHFSPEDPGINYAIETGSLIGDSTEEIRRYFPRVYTIELNETCYQKTAQRFIKNSNIKCIQGDSKEVFKGLLPELRGNILFYLDAHWSGDSTVDWTKSNWKGYPGDRLGPGPVRPRNTSYVGESPTPENQCPLGEELKLIHDLFTGFAFIYINDLDKFGPSGCGLKDRGFKGEDWSHLNLNELRGYLSDRLTYWREVDGIQLIIKMKPKEK